MESHGSGEDSRGKAVCGSQDDAGYQERLKGQIEQYRTVTNAYALPSIFSYWSNKYILPRAKSVLNVGGVLDFFPEYFAMAIKAADNWNLLSIGCGDGAWEIGIAEKLIGRGITGFSFDCLELSPLLIERARKSAESSPAGSHLSFIECDINHWTAGKQYAGAMANHSLHHIANLEGLFLNVRRSLVPGNGVFAVADMIGRNGHMRWPEALYVIERIWEKAPDRYKYNHLLKRMEKEYINWDCSKGGFEGIRAQDILPELVENFKFDRFLAFGNLTDIFVDRAFGHNLSNQNEEDKSFIDNIHALNEDLIDIGYVKPTQIFAVMRTQWEKPPLAWKHWAPEFCVRDPRMETDLANIPLEASEAISRYLSFWPFASAQGKLREESP